MTSPTFLKPSFPTEPYLCQALPRKRMRGPIFKYDLGSATDEHFEHEAIQNRIVEIFGEIGHHTTAFKWDIGFIDVHDVRKEHLEFEVITHLVVLDTRNVLFINIENTALAVLVKLAVPGLERYEHVESGRLSTGIE